MTPRPPDPFDPSQFKPPPELIAPDLEVPHIPDLGPAAEAPPPPVFPDTAPIRERVGMNPPSGGGTRTGPPGSPMPRTKEMGTAEQLLKISTVGTNFAFSVMAAGLLGWLLQRFVIPGSAPWPLVVGLLVGLLLGAWRFVRDAKALMK
jgi:hypothetical protein